MTETIQDHGKETQQMTDMFVKYVNSQNKDLLAVNAARVSFGKFKAEFDAKDQRLLNYLAKHNHWSPFSHPRYQGLFRFPRWVADYMLEDRTLSAGVSGMRIMKQTPNWVQAYADISLYGLYHLGGGDFIKDNAPECHAALTAHVEPAVEANGVLLIESECPYIELHAHTFHVKAPISVARQLVKHWQGVSFNEISRRYVSFEPEFYMWEHGVREAVKDKKQGSGENLSDDAFARFLLNTSTSNAKINYADALQARVCPEQARDMLTLNTMTEWYWTTTVEHWKRIIKQRLDPHAQYETRFIAAKIEDFLMSLYGE